MGKKILVAFDESENAMRAAEFVAKSMKPDGKITLFGVIPDTAAICNMQSPELTPYFVSQQINFCTIEDKKRDLINEAMKKAKAHLLEAGFRDEDVSVMVHTIEKGVARDIIIEANRGYDAVVLGRKGLSGLQEFFLGSVAQKVLHGCKEASVLLIS